jgi:hypothetical protein
MGLHCIKCSTINSFFCLSRYITSTHLVNIATMNYTQPFFVSANFIENTEKVVTMTTRVWPLYGSMYRKVLWNRATPKKVQLSYVLRARSKRKVAIKIVLLTFQPIPVGTNLTATDFHEIWYWKLIKQFIDNVDLRSALRFITQRTRRRSGGTPVTLCTPS